MIFQVSVGYIVPGGSADIFMYRYDISGIFQASLAKSARAEKWS